MSAIRLTVLTFSIAIAANLGMARAESPKVWRPLSEFESVEAFEKQLSVNQEACLARAGGGSMAVNCFELYELWDGELNVQYKRLQSVLDDEGKTLLTESQRNWISLRDSANSFNSHVLGLSYSAPGTMWIAIRAGVADQAAAEIVRSRTLMLLDWEKRWSRGQIDEESLLND